MSEISNFESNMSDPIKDDFKIILNELRKNEGDELVNEFEKVFRNRVPDDIQELIRAREDKNIVEIRIKGHFLSTTFLTLKFSQGLALTVELEKAVDRNQEEYALLLADRLIDYLNKAVNEI